MTPTPKDAVPVPKGTVPSGSVCAAEAAGTEVPSSSNAPQSPADRDEAFPLLLLWHVALSYSLLQEGGALEGQEQILALIR